MILSNQEQSWEDESKIKMLFGNFRFQLGLNPKQKKK